MKRRTFVWLSAVSAASIYVPAACRPRNAAGNTLARPFFLAHICDEKTIRAIGMTYKKQTPDEATKDRLTQLIRTDVSGNVIPEQTDSKKLDALLLEKVTQDFETGRTVIVNGWVLSQTEARQCALLSSLA